MEEVWKDIKDYEGLYQVSNLGRIRSINRVVPHNKEHGSRKLTSKVIHQGISTKGYPCTAISKNGKVKCIRLHRVVAETFIPNPNNLPEVNHKDENKLNNVVSNLEWCDHLYNIRYGTGAKRSARSRIGIANAKGETVGSSKLKEHQVIEIFHSPLLYSEISKIYGVGASCISTIKNKNGWKHITNNL